MDLYNVMAYNELTGSNIGNVGNVRDKFNTQNEGLMSVVGTFSYLGDIIGSISDKYHELRYRYSIEYKKEIDVQGIDNQQQFISMDKSKIKDKISFLREHANKIDPNEVVSDNENNKNFKKVPK